MSQAPTQDFIVNSGLTVLGTATVTSSTGNTGTLQVNGGAAIAKNLIVGLDVEIGGDLIVRGSIPSLSVTTGTFTNLTVNGLSTLNATTLGVSTATQLDVASRLLVGGLSQLNNATLSNQTNSTSSTTGALTVAGGVGIEKDLFVAGRAFVSGYEVLTTATIIASTLEAVTQQGSSTTVAISILNTVTSTSTNSGALTVTGGVGIGGALYANELYITTSSYVNNSLLITTATIGNFSVGSITAGTDTAVSTSTGAILIWNTSNLQTITNRGAQTSNAVTISNTNSSISTTTGALTVAGGVGIEKDVYVGGTIYGTFIGSGIISTATNIAGGTAGQVPYQTTSGATSFYGPGIAGNVLVSNGTSAPTYNNTLTLASTLSNTTTVAGNALQVVGGVGIEGSLFVHGPAYFVNNVIFSGTSTSIFSTATVYTDNYIDLHFPSGLSGPDGRWLVDDGKDIGHIYHHYKDATGDEHGALIWHNLSDELRWYMGGVDLNTATQVWDVSTATYGAFRTGTILLEHTTSATSTTTGTLVVVGGVGIGGALYVERKSYINGSEILTAATIGSFGVGNITAGTDTRVSTSTGAVLIWNTSTLQSITNRGNATSNQIVITNTSTATSTNTGALQVVGGVGIGGDLYIGNRLRIKNTNIIAGIDSVAGWAYDSTFSVANPTDIFFKSDGLVMYLAFAASITQYNLSVAWDITTAVAGTSFSMSLIDTATNGLFISPDGTKMITCGQTGVVIANGSDVASQDRAYYFTLGTPWDVSSATLVSSQRFALGDAGGIPSAMTAPQAVDFNNDGTIMYIQDSTTDAVHQFALSSAYNVGTATWTKQFSVVGQESGGTGLRFNSSGTRMYLYGSTGDDVNEYRLGTAWDIATAVFYDKFYAGWYEITPNGIYINEAANVAFLCGSGNDVVLKFRTDRQAIEIDPETATSKIELAGNTRVADNFYVNGRTVLEGQVNTVGDLVTGGDITIGGNDLLVGSATAAATLFSGMTSGALSIATSQTTGAITIGGSGSTTNGAINIGQSTGTGQAINIASGANISGTTKTVNIATNGLSGSTSTVNIGSSATGALGLLNIFSTTTLILSTQAANSTSTGALQVRGGVGIGGALYVQQTSFINGAEILTTATIGSFGISAITAGTDTVVSTSTGAVLIWNTSTLQSITNRGAATTNAISITNTTSSISTTTGALQVRGGVGVGGSVYVGNRVGFVNTSNVSRVYQYYNAATDSLDTVFG
jgi:hypothetical protein